MLPPRTAHLAGIAKQISLGATLSGALDLEKNRALQVPRDDKKNSIQNHYCVEHMTIDGGRTDNKQQKLTGATSLKMKSHTPAT